MRLRLTMVVRNTDGLKAKLKAKGQAAKERLLEASREMADEVLKTAEARCPQDTGYMAQHLVVAFTRGGFNWTVGFRRGDFVGRTNPVTGKTITAFYPVFVIRGTRFMAGNDFLSAALRSKRRQIRAAYAKALRGE